MCRLRLVGVSRHAYLEIFSLMLSLNLVLILQQVHHTHKAVWMVSTFKVAALFVVVVSVAIASFAVVGSMFVFEQKCSYHLPKLVLLACMFVGCKNNKQNIFSSIFWHSHPF